ncbi:MAG: hypothetical protein PVJ05_07000 [Candidatus Thorarchaeota archaeon]
MTKLDGVKGNESVFHKIRCTYKDDIGDLVLTDKGVTFLKIKGMLGDGREQLHQFDFDEIRRVGTKKKKSGIYQHGIVIGHQSKSSEKQTYHYSCEEYKAVLFRSFFERQKLLRKSPEEVSSTTLSLSTIKRNADLLKVAENPKMRPYFISYSLEKIETEILNQLKNRFEADLLEVASSKQMHSLVALLHESDPKKIPKDQVYNTVTDLVSGLISRGELDGIVTESGRYVSNRALARINGPYDILADYATIFAQLHEKGILIWALECPTCSKKIKYPKKGKTTTCPSCKETLHAKDVLKKFVDLL